MARKAPIEEYRILNAQSLAAIFHNIPNYNSEVVLNYRFGALIEVEETHEVTSKLADRLQPLSISAAGQQYRHAGALICRSQTSYWIESSRGSVTGFNCNDRLTWGLLLPPLGE